VKTTKLDLFWPILRPTHPPTNGLETASVHMKNERAKDIGTRIQIGYKQPANLQQLVGGGERGIRGWWTNTPGAGCYKCYHCKVSCPILEETKYFRSTVTDKRYSIKQEINCEISWLIYLPTCTKCRGQYVGKSQTVFKKRHSWWLRLSKYLYNTNRRGAMFINYPI
jgi:hypothetical protein